MTWPEAKSTGPCVFQQEGESITGSCGGADRFPVKGRVEGTSRLSWELEVKQNGETGRMEFSGELNQEGTISGTCSVVGANSGTFSMKKSR